MWVKKTDFIERYKLKLLHLLDKIAEELEDEGFEFEMMETMDKGLKKCWCIKEE